MSLAQRITELAQRIGEEMRHLVATDHPGLARAWVNFGWEGGQVRIHAAHGVEDVIRLGRGRYRVIFAQPFQDAHYAWVAFARHAGKGGIRFAAARAEVEDKTAKDIEIAYLRPGGKLRDSPEISLIIYR